jgi:hypothetical protein
MAPRTQTWVRARTTRRLLARSQDLLENISATGVSTKVLSKSHLALREGVKADKQCNDQVAK